MKITVPLTDGFLPARFTKHADATDFLAGVPVRSFPITITEAPTATQAFALSLIDFDATPVCAFPWVHWLAAKAKTAMPIPLRPGQQGWRPVIPVRNHRIKPTPIR